MEITCILKKTLYAFSINTDVHVNKPQDSYVKKYVFHTLAKFTEQKHLRSMKLLTVLTAGSMPVLKGVKKKERKREVKSVPIYLLTFRTHDVEYVYHHVTLKITESYSQLKAMILSKHDHLINMVSSRNCKFVYS